MNLVLKKQNGDIRNVLTSSPKLDILRSKVATYTVCLYLIIRENIRMAKNKAVEFAIRGTLDWCKLIGPARPYTGDPKFDKGPSWSIEISPDKNSRALLEKHGMSEKVKKDKPTVKNPRKYEFVRLTVLEFKADGTKNKLPEIIDASGRKWGEDEIGNGSVADILVRAVDYGTTKGLYYKKMRVLKHVPYEGGSDFEPLSEDDEFFAGNEPTAGTADNSAAPSPQAASRSDAPDADDDLDDDVPF
jgi:hypothetical protein